MSFRILYAPWLRPIMSLFVPNWLAITIGRTIITGGPLDDRTLAHELVHVEQWGQYGPLFLFRYIGASIRASLNGGHWYRDNRFEAEARESALLL